MAETVSEFICRVDKIIVEQRKCGLFPSYGFIVFKAMRDDRYGANRQQSDWTWTLEADLMSRWQRLFCDNSECFRFIKDAVKAGVLIEDLKINSKTNGVLR